MGRTDLAQERDRWRAVSGERGHEPPGFIKFREFLDSQGLCSMNFGSVTTLNRMSTAKRANRTGKNTTHTQICWSRNMTEKDLSGSSNKRKNRTPILTESLKNKMWGWDLICLRKKPAPCFCEHGNKTIGFQKGVKFLGWQLTDNELIKTDSVPLFN
jgi:hypothetical protein